MPGDGEADGVNLPHFPDSVDRLFGGYVFDLDGTLYLGQSLLPGAREAVSAVRGAGSRVVFLTNKPLERPSDYALKLTGLGIPATTRDVVSSTDSLLRYLAATAQGARLYPVGEPLLWDLLSEAGWEITDDPARVDLVVVAFDRTFTYAKLRIAFDAIRAGARLIATNPDAFCPMPDGPLPDCAAMLAAIEACTGVRAEAIVGKPATHMAATLVERLDLDPAETLLVGDRLDTDMLMARETGMLGALVLTGATTLADLELSGQRPDFVVNSVADVVPPRLRAPGSQSRSMGACRPSATAQ